MTQKDKVKELVGRGLHSYHTKALQQMDRIEKKNKEQNHKINILTNELDNDYLTKTEEGSVVSLEHSKEGMVYLDELQGNTLVNYCTDGSKEITLNGGIDLEGTFVTTTEGVDNGKVDVMCEGNTLINKLYKIKNYGSPAEFKKYGWSTTPNNCTNFEWIDNGIKLYAFSDDTKLDRYYRSSPDKYGIFKKNRTYIVRMNVNSNNLQQNAAILRCFYGNGTVFMDGQMSEVVNGVFIKKATTSSTIEEVDAIHSMISLDYRTLQGVDGWVSFQNVMVIDVTDLPSYQQDVEYWRNIEYFEGMKSVGQDDENGHKIEILSQNKNYIDLTKKTDTSNGAKMVIEDDVVTLTSIGSYSWCYNGIKLNHLKPNTKYICKGIVEGGNPQSTFRVHDFNGAISTTFKNSLVFTTPSDVSGLCLLFYISTNSPCETGETAVFKNIQLEKSENSTDYVKRQSNKKEILLNEPLRSIENINKDRIVKIGNKLFIERNLAQITLDGTENWIKWSYETPLTQLDTHLHCTIRIANIKYYSKECANLITDKFKSVSTRGALGEHIYHDGWNDTICIKILQSKLETPDVSGFKKWLQNNPIELIYELATPIYEPLEIEPILNTYTDITHISNNSIIPCNMKVKNSGYNVIIKPSTLYTVALDTNKSGTIGMNLGGVKGTTTNNVLTLTTPATLTDDSLRLYGKGIKGSKVRLLEGDKTNWIPSHFEGMKSSFEDKFNATDNTYKMEILSNNKNLFDIDKTYYKAGWGEQNYQKYKNGFSFCSKNGWNSIGYAFESLKNKTVTVCATVTCVNKDTSKQQEQHFSIIPVEYGYPTSVIFRDGETKKVKFNITLKDNGRVYFIGASNNEGSNEGGIQWFLEDISVVEGIENDYIPRECNKIQFSSIEPLRSVGNTKDKFVFKNNKLMIERNIGEITIKDTILSTSKSIDTNRTYTTRFILDKKLFPNIKLQTGNAFKSDRFKHTSWSLDVEGFGIGSNLDFNILNIRLSSLDVKGLAEWFKNNPTKFAYILTEPTYEEIPFELQKIILEGYENGTLFFDTNIPPTSTITYAGETPIVKATKLNKTEVLNNTTDINDNIIPYLMDMDYRVVCLELATETQGISMARLFGGAYEMLQRDIQSKRYSIDEYRHRLDAYLGANKITEDEYNKLGDMLND